jgi:hypothetical protein
MHGVSPIVLKQACTILLSDLNGDFSFEHLWDPGGLILLGGYLQQLEEILTTKTSVSVGVSGWQAFAGYVCDSFEHSYDQSWFQLCSAGKASVFCYGAEQFQWTIAWLTTRLVYSVHYGMPLYLNLDCSTMICPIGIEVTTLAISSIFVLHLHWDPGGFTLVVFCAPTISWTDAMPKSMGGFELVHWTNAWSLNLDCYGSGRMSGQSLDPTTVRSAGEFSWDPGIWTLLFFYEILAQTATHGGIIAEAPGYCYNHYMVAFFDQIIFSHGYCTNDDHRYHHRGKIKESHGPWDPGGSTWHRLGVKPDFMEGGLLATYPMGRYGLDDGLALLGFVPTEGSKGNRYIYQENDTQKGGLEQEGFGLARSTLVSVRFSLAMVYSL